MQFEMLKSFFLQYLFVMFNCKMFSYVCHVDRIIVLFRIYVIFPSQCNDIRIAHMNNVESTVQNNMQLSYSSN